MDLRRQLEAQRTAFFARAPADEAEIIRRTDAALTAEGVERRVRKPGDHAPSFALPDARGRIVSSLDLLAQGPVVVVFYRGAWCPYCNLELRAYQKVLPEIRALGAALVAISPQTPGGTAEAVEKNALDFDVLSDVGNGVAASFGLIHDVPPELQALYAKWKLDLPRLNGTDDWRLPLPGTFVIGSDGRIALAHADADYRVRLEPSDVLRTLARLSPADRRVAGIR